MERAWSTARIETAPPATRASISSSVSIYSRGCIIPGAGKGQGAPREVPWLARAGYALGKTWDGMESFPGARLCQGSDPRMVLPPSQNSSRSGVARDCSPCAGCDQDSLFFSAMCLSSPARAGVAFISYPLSPTYGEYMGHLWAEQGLCQGGRYGSGSEGKGRRSSTHCRPVLHLG